MPGHASSRTTMTEMQVQLPKQVLPSALGKKGLMEPNNLSKTVFHEGISQCLFGRTLMRIADSDVSLKGCFQ